MKNEVLIQKSHRYGYDHAVRATGIRMVEIESADDLGRAVKPGTAMMLFFNDAEPKGQIKAEEWVSLGRKHKVPTFIDASADVPRDEPDALHEDGLRPCDLFRREGNSGTAERGHSRRAERSDSGGAAEHFAL